MKRSAWIAFLVAEAILYCSFLFLDLQTETDTKWLKFFTILLISVVSFWSGDKIIHAALCLTAAADVFLLVLDQWYGIGIFLFFIVQLLYSVHLRSKTILRFQIVLITASFIITLLTKQIELFAIGYITVFLLNLIHAASYAAQLKGRQSALFFLGLLLFFCCDLCVGYYNIGSGSVWAFARVAMWGFYLPGQILILLSAFSNQGETS